MALVKDWYWRTIVGLLAWLGSPTLGAVAFVPKTSLLPDQPMDEWLLSTRFVPSPADSELLASAFPSFHSPVLDQQLRRYRRYVYTIGVPDVMIVGSSRALQGVDPIALQAALVERGYPRLRIFNLSINGATAQVVDRLIQKILPPEQLPRLIIWADGLRAFNSSRPDRTHDMILRSPGYRAVLAGQYPTRLQTLPTAQESEQSSPEACDESIAVILDNDYAQPLGCPPVVARPSFAERIRQKVSLTQPEEVGFSVVVARFDPTTYYQSYPRIAGQFDGDYQNLNLGGPQGIATNNLIRFTQTQQITLVIVNLPLSRHHLDTFRLEREATFRQHLTRLAATTTLQFIDLGQAALDRSDYFADPSHLNRYGASFIAYQLARHPSIWRQFKKDEE